ncbi:hypothetical protein GCM10010116_01160 [Microbispora rosea subsp. aerata]|nr:hypothetical protein [Microbispora rosea]GGO00745.1 hypothetical protein GCM10010116_01160 [Microbispora rosea subsp. aerata]GIH56867.1 hypothetical protein Mro02_37810 [Microbispora rosea subsp. aerata]GLJ84352.1 hypothetical protein GCM10017588_30800 [Microbispora rosea subsp. aerata]
MFRPWQRFLLVYLPGGVYLAVVLAIWILRDRLPDPAASHFTSGVPDASRALWELVLISLGPPALTWLFLAFLVRLRVPGSIGRRVGAGVIVGQAFLYGTAALLGIVFANLDAPTWREAHSEAHYPAVAAAMGLAGVVIGAALVDPWRAAEPPALPLPEPYDETDGDGGETGGSARRRMWVGHARNRFLLWYSAAGLALFVFVLPWTLWTLAGAVYTLFTLYLASGATATFDGCTLRVYGFPAVFPLRRIRLARVENAEAVELDPLAWGGWGWRALSLRRHAFVIRGGEALHIALRGGGEFLVTVSDAARGAALIRRSLRARSGPGSARRSADIPLTQGGE